jgi:hypothetical protein
MKSKFEMPTANYHSATYPELNGKILFFFLKKNTLRDILSKVDTG